MVLSPHYTRTRGPCSGIESEEAGIKGCEQDPIATFRRSGRVRITPVGDSPRGQAFVEPCGKVEFRIEHP